jgi:hypothetical protein
MHRPLSFALFAFILVAGVTSGCDDADPPGGPSEPPPVEVSETFTGRVTVNGAQTHSFSVTRAGNLSARFGSLSGDGTVVGLSLGTWNGEVCALIITNDNASAATTVPGTATSLGSFCVRVYDVGRLTDAVDYEVVVTHF